MIGMLQILTYMLGLYLVVKGVEVLQIGLASSRTGAMRIVVIVIGLLTLGVCVAGAAMFINWQDQQAFSSSSSSPRF